MCLEVKLQAQKETLKELQDSTWRQRELPPLFADYQQRLIVFDSDSATSRFLDYAKRQARIEDSGNLFFSDIVPVAATAPNVAAMAFYHTLVLASKKAIEVVGQVEPYGEVCSRSRFFFLLGQSRWLTWTVCTCYLDRAGHSGICVLKARETR